MNDKNGAINSYNENYYFIDNAICKLADYAITKIGVYFVFEAEKDLNVIKYYNGTPYSVTDKNEISYEVLSKDEFYIDNLLFYIFYGSGGYLTWKAFYKYEFNKYYQEDQKPQSNSNNIIIFVSKKELFKSFGVGW